MAVVRRNPIEGLAPADAIQARCNRCDGKIVMVAGTRSELLTGLIGHNEGNHDGDANVMVLLEGESGHFTIEKAPPARCDLCGVPAELPWWVMVTPPSADYRAEDPEWCVCDPCFALVNARDVIGLCRRAWEVGMTEFVVEDERLRKEQIRDVMTQFLSNVDPTQTRRDSA